MSLATGTRVGPYEVIGLLGSGGMGEVYRARDPKLGRDVALKILPEPFAGDFDRVARFRREGQVLASLNHPNIAAIYGVEDAGGVRALVLELVEGPTLANRLAAGPIPLDEALPIARQMAEALEAAHGQDIVHRDLKPANVKLRPDGTVKILDFGLAKALEPASVDATVSSPTITSPALTQMGVILGTAAYMSPEQAKGRPADRRSDIWAFGCVLFEMLTGKRAFEGEDVADTLAFILTREPAWSTLPPVPASLRRLLRRSLAKQPKQRLADAADARLDIEDALGDQALDAGAASPETIDRRPRRGTAALPWALTALAIAAAALAWVKPWATPPLRTPMRLSAELGADVMLATDPGGAIALSNDGTTLAFSARKATSTLPAIYVRRLDQLQATELRGTDGGFAPFFSPDGQSVGFFTEGKLKRTTIHGGSPANICDARGRGGAWSEDGTIVFASAGTEGRLLRVPSTGGTPEPLTVLVDGEVTHRWPQLLPGGRAVLFTAHTSGIDFDSASLVVQPLPSGERKVIRRSAYAGRVLRSGHLLYVFEQTLFAARFDPERLELIEPVMPVADGISALSRSGGAQYAVSNEGVLVYFHGLGTNDRPMAWLDRAGKTTPLRTAAANWTNIRFDPGGRRLAFDMINGRNWDVWTYDWERGTSSKITDDLAEETTPVWSPKGRGIAFASRRPGSAFEVNWRRADGTGDVQRLTDGPSFLRPESWHPTGKFLLLTENRRWSRDIVVLPMEGDESSGWKAGKRSVFIENPANEDSPEFSTDGHWVAYRANYTGRPEVYVQPFPGPGERTPISSNGGEFPTWSRTRNELVFAESVSGPDAGRRLMVVTYAVESGSFRPSKPVPWSNTLLTWQLGRFFDLHPDGARFAIADVPQPQGSTRQDTLTFVFNFFDELQRMTTPPR